MPLHLLNGEVEDSEIVNLRDRVSELEGQIEQSDATIADLRAKLSAATRSVSPLRKELTPLYTALKKLFGDMDAAGVVEDSGTTSVSPGKYEAWKARVSPSERTVIELLEISGSMTITQLSKAAKCHYDTAKAAVRNLIGKGIAVRNGNEITLKP